MLKNKFRYNDELLIFSSDLIPNLINFYGEENKNVILSALANCEIHFQGEKEPQTFLNSYFGANKE